MSDDAAIVAVEYVGQVWDVKTMADHTYRVTFVLPEYCADQAAWFLKHHHDMVRSVSHLESLIKLDNETPKEEAERSGSRVDSRRVRDRRDQRASREV